jgi:hypothetical protein
MTQELIDLLLGEMEPGEETRLRERILREPALAREFEDLSSLFRLMERGERLEPSAALRSRVLRAARKQPLARALESLRAFPGLLAYRFRHSMLFRVALLSAAAHLLLAGVLLQFVAERRAREESLPEIAFRDDPAAPVPPPGRELLLRLGGRSLPHARLLERVGVPGQQEAIARGIARLLDSQRPDGSFGEIGETGYAALALLAEGHTSIGASREGEALGRALSWIRASAARGGSHGAALSALVEDYVLCYDSIPDEARAGYVEAAIAMAPSLGEGEDAIEALSLALWARLPVRHARIAEVPALGADREAILLEKPSRVGATRLFAKGAQSPPPERARDWAEPLFRAALADLEEGRGIARAILTLQSPYRL